MSGLLHRDIAAALEQRAQPRWQESYDNTGWQCGDPSCRCTGVLLCVDVTDEIVAEAVACGCNLVVSHHPLIFHGVKSLSDDTRVIRALLAAIKACVAVYSCHTPIDQAHGGISWAIASRLGLENITVLSKTGELDGQSMGYGIVGDLPCALDKTALVGLVKTACNSPVVRCSAPSQAPCTTVCRVALCGGSGAEFIDEAVAQGADAYITSDVKYNVFLDVAHRIFLVDIGHWEAEQCSKDIFYRIIKEKFPTFVVKCSQIERNPINYL